MNKSIESSVCINGISFSVFDYEKSGTVAALKLEMDDDFYNIDSIPFEDGDIIIDIGANIGVVSMYAALKYPFIKIYAIESCILNYNNMLLGIQKNNITNIIPFNLAMGKDDSIVRNIVSLENTGWSTTQFDDLKCEDYENEKHILTTVQGISFDNFIRNNKISKIKLLKIDCEGAEYDILDNSSYLDITENVSSEFHISDKLRSKGFSPETTSSKIIEKLGRDHFKGLLISFDPTLSISKM